MAARHFSDADVNTDFKAQHKPLSLKAMVRELEIHEVFPTLKKDESIYAGVFNSDHYPYSPAPPVRCNYFATMLFIQGSGFLVVDSYEFEVKPNRVFLFTDRQVIGWGYYENTIALTIAFTSHIAMALNIRYDAHYIDLPEADTALFREVYEHCVRTFDRREPGAADILQSAIGYSYRLLSGKGSGQDINNRSIAAIREIVCRDFSLNHTVESIAHTLTTPVREMNERCMQALGISVKQYMLDLKLTEAKRLLAFTQLTSSEICYQTGFEDPSYFTRLFRKKAGMTPGEFREKYQKKA
jgi:AraC-like DNA-binding protein